MRFASRLAAALVAFLAVFATALTPAQAAYPPGGQPYITISTSAITNGVAFTVEGFNFAARVQATITLHSDPITLGTATTDDNGHFVFPGQLLCNTVTGTHTITGTAGGLSASAPVTVSGCDSTQSNGGLAQSGGGSSGLSNTGVAIIWALVLALIAVIIGTAFVVAGRRRDRMVV